MAIFERYADSLDKNVYLYTGGARLKNQPVYMVSILLCEWL